MKKLAKVGGNKGRVEAVLKEELEKRFSDGDAEDFTCVMKFGGSSVASAERMREIADLILTFPEERPVVVLSAMGKTTNKLLVVIYAPVKFCFVLFLNVLCCVEGSWN